MGKLIQRIRDWFEEYLHENIPESMKAHEMISLKRDHSARVSNNCATIAGKLGWPKEDMDAATVMGLLHDIGRFVQFSEYRTFSDDKSVNHGEAGYKAVLDADILAGLDRRLFHGILDGIRYHNLRRIPVSVTEESLPFVKLVRDADKLDIFRLIQQSRDNGSIEKRLETAIGLDYHAPVNPDALCEVMKGETVSNQNVKSGADFMLMQLSWVFDINYPSTFQLLDEAKLLEKIIDELPKHPDLQKAVDFLMGYRAGILQ